MTADGSHGICWGASDWRGSAKNPLITVAHSDYFHGDVGNPYRRSVDNTSHDVRGQAEDPSTNEFAAHLATLDFEELEKKFEDDPALAAREDAALNAAVAKLQRSQGEPGSPRLHPRDMTKKTLSKRALRLGTCTAVRNDPEGITQDCYCYESTNQVGTSARYSVTCQGNEAATNSWSRGIMFDAVGNLRYLIERLNEFGWNGLVTVAGSHAGTVLFVPQNTRQQPSDRSANCCELLIHNVVTNANILPRDCFCHQDAPYQGWNMMTQNPMDIVAS
ncbi:uncharacterized protein CTRU02_215129 [Colletotrichum truncatum]|uniref:Uncharacterized protein n=1 Tax=Colletotrichum truncatum TaxID=5467 RepID=A0ACC3YDN2_COLTU|nr:uncharacterized protein CTRU02_13684 [Colletotrichum truncatum]KAF6783032.1 hypothetical protein CTRU02_13684 [Colletotrichum truncatum]